MLNHVASATTAGDAHGLSTDHHVDFSNVTCFRLDESVPDERGPSASG